MTAPNRIFVTTATEEHAESLAAFYREVWDPDSTPESVVAGMRQSAAANVADPGEVPPTAMVMQGTRVIGYCSSIPQRLWDGVRERPAYWVKGLMVLPEYRGGPVGHLAAKELTRHLPCSTSLSVSPAARRLFGALGYNDLGAVTNWLRPLRAGFVARQLDPMTLGLDSLPTWVTSGFRAAQRTGVASLAAGAVGLLATAAAAVARMPSAGLDTEDRGIPGPSDLDSLWEATRTRIAASPVRDSRYLIPRFSGGAGHDPYSFALTREAGRLVGAAVVRKPKETSDTRLGPIRIATISDILFDPTRRDAGLATLGAVERNARSEGADAITCMTRHEGLTKLLRTQGYVRLKGNVHFFLRDSMPSQWPTDLVAWWLSRGDGESDGTF